MESFLRTTVLLVKMRSARQLISYSTLDTISVCSGTLECTKIFLCGRLSESGRSEFYSSASETSPLRAQMTILVLVSEWKRITDENKFWCACQYPLAILTSPIEAAHVPSRSDIRSLTFKSVSSESETFFQLDLSRSSMNAHRLWIECVCVYGYA